MSSRGDYFRFGSAFIKKKSNRFKKNQNRTETGSNRLVSVILEQKPVQTGFSSLARFSWVGSVISSLARFFLVLDSVWFFRFRAYKTEPNWSVFLKF